MPRATRVDVGGYVYHVLNRANARAQIFDTDADYTLFESLLEIGAQEYDMRILAYCLMPNHWHLVLYPKNDTDLSRFVGWLSNAHTRKWHVEKKTVGQGHLYQGRYKSFLCESDGHLLILLRYVERNALKANLVKKAEDWKWSSIWKRVHGTHTQKAFLTNWPIDMPTNYLELLNTSQSKEEEEALERSETKGSPFGGDTWKQKMIEDFGLEQTIRAVGRPKNSG